MGVDKREYGTVNDLAYTSAHGRERNIPTRRPSPAERIRKKAEGKAAWQAAWRQREMNAKRDILDR